MGICGMSLSLGSLDADGEGEAEGAATSHLRALLSMITPK